MAQRPTAGYNIHFDGLAATDVVGALLEHDVTFEGDTEDVSGTGDTQGDIVRRKGKPVDVGGTATFTLILDESAANFDAFVSAMEGRTADSKIAILDDAFTGWQYTGHAESFSQTLTRSESVWKANLTFYVNSESDVTTGSVV